MNIVDTYIKRNGSIVIIISYPEGSRDNAIKIATSYNKSINGQLIDILKPPKEKKDIQIVYGSIFDLADISKKALHIHLSISQDRYKSQKNKNDWDAYVEHLKSVNIHKFVSINKLKDENLESFVDNIWKVTMDRIEQRLTNNMQRMRRKR